MNITSGPSHDTLAPHPGKHLPTSEKAQVVLSPSKSPRWGVSGGAGGSGSSSCWESSTILIWRGKSHPAGNFRVLTNVFAPHLCQHDCTHNHTSNVKWRCSFTHVRARACVQKSFGLPRVSNCSSLVFSISMASWLFDPIPLSNFQGLAPLKPGNGYLLQHVVVGQWKMEGRSSYQ